jgi:hypothetical protein
MSEREITVQWNHIDGPMMRLPDGQLRWMTLRERFMHWIGRWSLEDIARRPGDLKLVYYPPHDTWLRLSAETASQEDQPYVRNSNHE